jgi:hypothetical protein
MSVFRRDLPGCVAVVVGSLLPAFHVVRGQAPASPATPVSITRAAVVPDCDYHACALSIVPTWNGLAVVRGTSGPRVANLNFFVPRSIETALRGPAPEWPGADSAAASARRAVQLRRMGAVLTDAGLLASALVLARVVDRKRAGRGEQRAGAAALGALVLSVPFQFAADGALSRAVWWHNLRFAP